VDPRVPSYQPRLLAARQRAIEARRRFTALSGDAPERLEIQRAFSAAVDILGHDIPDVENMERLLDKVEAGLDRAEQL
jgi:hypothetical protein